MNKLSDDDVLKLNKADPTSQLLYLGSRLKDIEDYALFQITFEITEDGTSGLNLPALPFPFEIFDVIVQSRALSASGTVTLRSGTNAITDAIACAADEAIDRAASIDDAYSTLAEGAVLNVITNGATDRGLVTIIGRRPS